MSILSYLQPSPSCGPQEPRFVSRLRLKETEPPQSRRDAGITCTITRFRGASNYVARLCFLDSGSICCSADGCATPEDATQPCQRAKEKCIDRVLIDCVRRPLLSCSYRVFKRGYCASNPRAGAEIWKRSLRQYLASGSSFPSRQLCRQWEVCSEVAAGASGLR